MVEVRANVVEVDRKIKQVSLMRTSHCTVFVSESVLVTWWAVIMTNALMNGFISSVLILSKSPRNLGSVLNAQQKKRAEKRGKGNSRRKKYSCIKLSGGNPSTIGPS